VWRSLSGLLPRSVAYSVELVLLNKHQILADEADLHCHPVIEYVTSHTRTVVRECFKGDEASQWKRPKFDPSPHQNPLTDLHKNWQA